MKDLLALLFTAVVILVIWSVSFKLMVIVGLMSLSVMVSTGVEEGAKNFRGSIALHKGCCNLHWILMCFYAFALDHVPAQSKAHGFLIVMIPISATLYVIASVQAHKILRPSASGGTDGKLATPRTAGYFESGEEKRNVLLAAAALAAVLLTIYISGFKI